MEKTIKRRTTTLLPALILMAPSCASTTPQSLHGDPTGYAVAATVTKDMVTVQNLLRWPLEGQAVGTNKVIAGLREVYKMETVTDGYYAKGAKSLADNYVLSFVSISNITGAIDIGLKQEPCYPAERAAAAIGAVPDPVVEDAHRVDRGKSFKTTQNGVSVDFSTTPLTYRCVTSIHISPALKSDQGTKAIVTKDMVTVENMLRWPLEGKTGVDKVTAGLKQMFELEELEPSWFAGDGPVRLADGYILSFTWIGPGTNRIDIGVEGLPCFPPERAMELTGAVQGIVRTDMHGGEYGKEYAVENHGIRLTFGTTPRTYKCVDSIYITPALKSIRGTKI